MGCISVFVFGTLSGLVLHAIADSYFILQGSEDWQSSIDESFFSCDRTDSCRGVGKSQLKFEQKNNEEEEGKFMWKKEGVYASCSEAWKSKREAGDYWVRHYKMPSPVKVKCLKDGGEIKASFDHDSEKRIEVSGYEAHSSYQRKIQYKNRLSDVISFAETSRKCRQFVRIDCKGMLLKSNHGDLIDKLGNSLGYFGGADETGKGCSCGVDGSCLDSQLLCNCDSERSEWKYDEGYVTDKSRLPLTQVRLGDTGHNGEEGAHTIGRLECLD